MDEKTNSVLAAPPAAAAADTATWFIDANTLHCIDQQETNLTHGDEVYVASIRFRTTLGVAGSTSTAFTGGLVDINDLNTGESRTIPNSMGRVAFPNVTRLGAAELLAGQHLQVIGTATTVVESDLSSNNLVNKLFTEAADEVRPILAAATEGLSLADLTDEDALPGVFAQLVTDVNDAIQPTLLQKLKLFVTSFGDADDPIDRKLNVFVAVDDALAPLVDDTLGDALDPSVGVAGALRTRSYTQRFEGRGAIYDVDFSVSK